MIFYGLVAQSESMYKPICKFEAKNIDEAHEYVKEAKEYGALLFKYEGYKRITKNNMTIYCIQKVLQGVCEGKLIYGGMRDVETRG